MGLESVFMKNGALRSLIIDSRSELMCVGQA
jgi:hypothetical protein